MSSKQFSLYWKLLKKSSNYLILISLSVSVLASVSVSTLADTLNSTIYVKVDINESDANNVTASIYNGRIYNETTQIIDSNLENKSYLFKFDVKNVPISSKEEIENADEDEDVEFRVCTFMDKYKNNYTQTACKNIVVDDTKENITFSIK
ncbi:MAG TPA: hypothetical protein VFB48_01075 [Nitrososphaeraceae archaeon]|nr:hypothetical protein [Nitrososphaeraceae archaeon]